jgi:hypothetical protein
VVAGVRVRGSGWPQKLSVWCCVAWQYPSNAPSEGVPLSKRSVLSFLVLLSGSLSAQATEDYAAWPVLKSTFPSTGGGGITIKGYDPVVTGEKCVTTFMAVEDGANPAAYPNVIEFDAVPEQGGILCTNGKWRAFEGGAQGTAFPRVL